MNFIMRILQTLIMLVLLASYPTLQAATNMTPCETYQKIHKRFPSGATWDFCWTIRKHEGLHLSQVYYAAPNQAKRRILGEASLAEVLTVPDNNKIKPRFSVTQYGLGGINSIRLSSTDCPDGNLRKVDGENKLCRSTYTYNHHYRTNSARPGTYFEIFSASQVESRSYITRWRFYENGIIEPALGASGEIQPGGELTNKSFLEHAIWRLDFDIGSDHKNDIVEEISSIPDQLRLKKTKKTEVFKRETARILEPESKRFWRVRDNLLKNTEGRFISYEIAPLLYSHSHSNVRQQEWLNNDIYITRQHDCERYAAKNHVVNPNCKFNLMNYIATPEQLDKEDIVIWYKQSLHHIDRDEDYNRIGTTWNTFQLLPRDWHAKNPF